MTTGDPVTAAALIAHLVAGGASLEHAEVLARGYARRCTGDAPGTGDAEGRVTPSSLTGKVQLRRGRPVKFSRQLDAQYLYAELRRLGASRRQAGRVIDALLGIGDGDRTRAARGPVASLPEHGTELALCSIAANAPLIAARLDDPVCDARAALARLPEGARSWIESAIGVIRDDFEGR